MAGPGSNLTGTRTRNTLTNNRSKRTATGASLLPGQGGGQTPPIIPTGNPGAPANSPTSPNRTGGGGGGGGQGVQLAPTATSQNPSALSVASPADYGSYAATLAGLEQQLAGATALARAGIGTARAQYGLDMNTARQDVIAGVSGAEQGALQSGILGSSADLANRGAAVAAGGAAKEQAAIDRANSIAQQRASLISATGQYYTGLGAAQTQLANAEAMAAISRFQNGLYDQWKSLRPLFNRGRRRDVNPTKATYAPAVGPNAQTGNPGYGGTGGRGYVVGGRT